MISRLGLHVMACVDCCSSEQSITAGDMGGLAQHSVLHIRTAIVL